MSHRRGSQHNQGEVEVVVWGRIASVITRDPAATQVSLISVPLSGR
jgi:hypothetical protein